MGIFEISVCGERVLVTSDEAGELLDAYRQHAVLSESFELESNGAFCCIAIGADKAGWPRLVVSQRYEPDGWGFHPGVLIVRETGVVFIGAGTRILAYRLQPDLERLWIDSVATGFWSWSRHGDFVMASAELELAAWSLTGEKCWSMFVEPPWTFSVEEDQVHLDVMGNLTTFPLASGPRPGRRS